jgi:hypothetical protein
MLLYVHAEIEHLGKRMVDGSSHFVRLGVDKRAWKGSKNDPYGNGLKLETSTHALLIK